MIVPIWEGETQIGKATINKEGLYAVIRCECMPLHHKPCRLYLQNTNEKISLGLCVPDGQSMRLIKRLPYRFVQDEIYIHMEEDKLKSYPHISGEPFEAIEKLTDARLDVRNGKYYIVISPSSKMSSTGQ